ncbi:hypothetical protein COV24_04120 [candidate division WWE3 bacterium CG10_big_fil_rev_8_21_14_0_10_32_10]|uniref:HAD family hydrolase n=1 Tax=candidate division WWE3 bacterium CG10_big_fil_rev_8_21_14_0_10_32_10 TaxID=1975090 RepID=A0A2H0R9J5_UNCKA|nr:MAG: hypothetical protein COV24_04120 [candidate division WWE3 bacterium CG10_big_fil_rev_8_21_14_0_10_32_10]
MNKYNYILLDWDGCLVNTLEYWINTNGELLRSYNYILTKKELSDLILSNKYKNKEVLKIITSKGYFNKALNIFLEYNKNTKFDENVKKTLKNLKDKNCKIAIVSNSPIKTAIDPVLKKESIESLFDVKIGRDDINYIKPNPEMINKAIKILHAKKEEVIIIGDTYSDIEAGKNAKITTVAYYPNRNEKYHSSKEVKSWKADFVIKKFKDILEIIS